MEALKDEIKDELRVEFREKMGNADKAAFYAIVARDIDTSVIIHGVQEQ